MDYNVNVQLAGTYLVEFRVASRTGRGRLELRNSNQEALSNVIINSTGSMQDWVTITDTIDLAAGGQLFRIYCVSGGWNINWFNFTYLGPTSVNEIQNANNNLLMIWPNPVNNNINLKYSVDKNSPLDFILCDIKGNQIAIKQINTNGSHSGELSWMLKSPLSQGTYFIYMLQNGKKIAVSKFVKRD